MREVEATASKDGKWWTITIDELDQTAGTKKLSDVEETAARLAATALEVAPEDLDVQVSYPVPEAVAQDWDAARAETRQAKELTIAAAAHTRTVVHQLHQDGYTGREIAKVLGMTFQRVSQILNHKD